MAANGIDIHNIFFPNQQIQDPKWFAGRKSDIEKALKSLCSPGASIMVYGDRGVGKTSFTEMIKLIAEGESHLIYKHNFQKRYAPEKFKFKIISVDCDADATSTAKVLQRLITSPLGIKKILSSRIEKIESTVKDRQALDLLKLIQLGTESETRITRTEFREDNIFETFSNLILTIKKNVLNPNEQLLISIDEFDLIEDSSKMASLIKNLSKYDVKFIISGIAESYDQLLQGHASVARQFTFGRINISPMTYAEVEDLFNLVEENSKKQIRFDNFFVKEIMERSKGNPYFVQLFGKLALESYMDQNGHFPVMINPKHLKNGVKTLGEFEYQMDKDYNSIVGENNVKELVIKFLAQSVSKKVKDEDVYAFCYKHNVMQPQPKNIIANLLGHRDPQFIRRETDDSDYVTFVDPLFKIFVNSREPDLIRKDGDRYVI